MTARVLARTAEAAIVAACTAATVLILIDTEPSVRNAGYALHATSAAVAVKYAADWVRGETGWSKVWTFVPLPGSGRTWLWGEAITRRRRPIAFAFVTLTGIGFGTAFGASGAWIARYLAAQVP